MRKSKLEFAINKKFPLSYWDKMFKGMRGEIVTDIYTGDKYQFNGIKFVRLLTKTN